MNAPILKAEPPPLPFHPGNAVALVLGALNGRTCDLPAEALRELTAHNDRLALAPSEEIEATLRRQAILLEHVELAYLRKAAEAKRPDHAAGYAGVALRAQTALMNVLGALRTIDENRKDAEALDA